MAVKPIHRKSDKRASQPRGAAGPGGNEAGPTEAVKRQKYLESVLRSAPDAIITLDAQHRVLEWNPGARLMFGYTAEEARGRDLDDLVAKPSVRSEAQGYTHRVLSGKRMPPQETVRYHRDGRPLSVIATGSPIMIEGEVQGVVAIYTDISPLKKTQRVLRESEERFRQLVENVEEIFWVQEPAGGKIIYLNPSFEAVFGLPAQTVYDDPAQFFRTAHPEDRDAVESALDVRFSRGKEAALEYRIRRPDRSIRWIRARTVGVRDEGGRLERVIGIAEDITDRKAAHDALKESHETFLAVLDGIDATIYVADMETYEVLFMNKYMQESFGGDLAGSICWKVFRGETGPCPHCTNARLIDAEGRPTGVCIWEDRNPITGRWYLNYDRAIKWVNGRYVRLQIATDITDRKDLEVKRQQTEARMRQAQKMEALGTLAGGIAHDFNNLLAAIIGYSELSLDDAHTGSPMHTNLKEVLSAAHRAKNLVRQILAFSRQSEHERKPLQMGLVVKEALKLLRSTLPATIQIDQRIEDGIPNVLADPTQIHQIVMNLCTNAAHAMQPGGGRLTVGLKPAQLDAEFAAHHPDLIPGNYLQLTVADTGHGMSAEVMAAIFDPYFTTKEKGEGTGMGLSVVHGIIKSYGGDITVESAPGEGTTFNVYIPAVAKEALEEPPPSEPLPSGNEHILFIDDEKTLAEMGRRILERLGYRVTTRTSVIEALELFKAQPRRFDLVITDMTMPHLTGDRLAAKLLAIRPGLPIILCTGYSKEISEETAREIGISAFIMKPLIIRDLAQIIREVLDPARR